MHGWLELYLCACHSALAVYDTYEPIVLGWLLESSGVQWSGAE